MSLMNITIKYIGIATGFMLGFFILAGPYYTVLTEFYDIAVAEGDTTLNAFLAWGYPALYYGYPTLTVFGIIWSVFKFYTKLRERYYATEEVYRYGS